MPEEEIRHVVLPNTEFFIAYKFKETIGFAASRHKKDEVYLTVSDPNINNVFSRLNYERGDAYFITFSVQLVSSSQK